MQVALRAKLRESLEDLISQEVLAPVSEPNPWILSMGGGTQAEWEIEDLFGPKGFELLLDVSTTSFLP